MKRQAGFTLVELMIVVVVLGILAAIAVPAYNQHVIRSKLVAATTGLAEYRVRLEQYYQDNRNYGTAATTPCGTAGPPQNPAYPTSQFFQFTCTVGATNQTFTAIASNVAGQGLGAANDYRYTINEQGQRTTTRYDGNAVALTEWKTK